MKLIRNATTTANPDLRGRKHHFTIENAPAATLEAMDDMLTAAGWSHDGCPCYDDGFGCGWWIDLSDVDQFKAAYKEAKAGVKEFMAQPVAPAEFEITIKGSVGVDNLFHPGDVVYCGSKLHMKAVVTTLPKIGDVIPATDLMGEYDTRVKVREILNDCPPRPAHLQAARDAHHNELFSGFFNDRVKPTEARKHELEDMSDDQIYVAFAVAPIATAKEIAARRLHRLSEETGFSIEQCRQELLAEEDDYFAALRNLRNVVIESHAEALDMDAARDVIEAAPVVVSAAHADQLSFWGENDYAARRAIVEECHAEALEMNAKKITPLLTREQNAAYIYQLDFFYQMNAVGRAAEIEGAHVAAIKLDAQMMHDAWDNADEIGRLIELEYAYDEALKMDEEITFVREMESLTAEQAMAYAEQWAYCTADVATQELMLERDHIEALSLNDKVDTDLAILRSDIKGFHREHTGARLEEVIDYAIRHTFNRIVQVYGVEIHRDSFTDLARTPEQKAFSGGMKTGANTDITTPLRIICDYMQRFMRNNKDAKLSEAKQRLESKIVVFINDGYDEQHLRQALSSATSSHSREAFTRALRVGCL